MVKKLLMPLYVTTGIIPFLILVYYTISNSDDKFIKSFKRINHSFLFYILNKKFNKTLSNDELINIIKNNTKNDNIEIHYRMIYDKKVPIYVYKNEDNLNVALMELQKNDKINLFRYLIIEQDDEDIILAKDNYTKKNKSHIKIINNKIYINLLSKIDFIKMEGFINNFGRMIENKFTVSDLVANKNTLIGTLFMLMVNIFSLLVIICTVQRCNNCVWSYLSIISILIGSYINIFDYDNNRYKDVVHYSAALSFYMLLPLCLYNLYDDKIVKNMSLTLFTSTIIFILLLIKYRIDRNNKLKKNNNYDFYEIVSSNTIEGYLILYSEYFLLIVLGLTLVRMISLYK